jgi:hypothetical protein
MTGINLSKIQVKNKWDRLKNDWSIWQKLVRKQTGTGWDSTRGVISMDNEWWKKMKKVSVYWLLNFEFFLMLFSLEMK